MKVLVTGANGFVGRSVSKFLNDQDQLEIVALGRDRLNLLNVENVREVLLKEKPEIVVHCAIKGGTRFDTDTQETFDQNVLMYSNLKLLKSNFECLINIGSGAEFDRSQSIRRAHESLLFKRSPSDFYGRAKNEIARDVVATDNFYNLRIFGCFGELEKENRFLKTIFNNNLKSYPIEIADNKEMDFVHVDDLARVVSFVLRNFKSNDVPKDINVVYSEKASLSEIVDLFIPANQRSAEVRVGPTSTIDYSGSSLTIEEIGVSNFSSSSLKTSLLAYYNQLKVQRGSN